MHLAFVAFHYFPYGGLTRDMRAMAELCQQRGHDVIIYVGSWQGPSLPHLKVEVIELKRTLSNAAYNQAFVSALQQRLKQDPSRRTVVGFNKMPGLDFYYAADTCFADKAQTRGRLYRATKRAKRYLEDEAAVFSTQSKTHSFMISRQEMAIYQRFYHTPSTRLHMLPPGIHRERIMPADYKTQRLQLRKKLGIADHQRVLLMVGSDFARKGLDRAIKGLAALPKDEKARTLLWAAGQDDPKPFNKLARQLGVADNVEILGARDDVSHLMWAADAFLHPAYSENTGTVILEAMVAGLPAIVTDVCGYAHYVEEAKLGEVIGEHDADTNMAASLTRVLSQPRSLWVSKSNDFSKKDLYSMTEHAVELIEATMRD